MLKLMGKKIFKILRWKFFIYLNLCVMGAVLGVRRKPELGSCVSGANLGSNLIIFSIYKNEYLTIETFDVLSFYYLNF